MLEFRENPNLMQQMESQLSGQIQEAGLAAAVLLEQKVSAGTRSGIHYTINPRRSSAEGEYPQEQQGDLKASVDVRPSADPLSFDVGFFDEDMYKLEYLEFYGNRAAHTSVGAGVRRPLYMLFEGKDSDITVSEMQRAISENG